MEARQSGSAGPNGNVLPISRGLRPGNSRMPYCRLRVLRRRSTVVMSAIIRALTVSLILLLLVAACGSDDNGSTDTPSPTPAVTVPPGEFPPGVIEFARTLDEALARGNVDLVKRSRFSDYDCPNNFFPAPGPNCSQVPEGEGVKAIGI